MKYDDEIIRLENGKTVEFKYENWRRCRDVEGLMQYVPSGALYLVIPLVADDDGPTKEFGAMLFAKGTRWIRPHELVDQARQAISAFMALENRPALKVVEPPSRPCRTFTARRRPEPR
jgi:hypothetical protein